MLSGKVPPEQFILSMDSATEVSAPNPSTYNKIHKFFRKKIVGNHPEKQRGNDIKVACGSARIVDPCYMASESSNMNHTAFHLICFLKLGLSLQIYF